LARALNHGRALRSPREVRNGLRYVLQNARRHGLSIDGIDPCSSGFAFDGWTPRAARPTPSSIVVPARTWLFRVGWRRHGSINLDDVPRR
jgi:hypothetical protein